MQKSIAILCAGGPAPGINTVISTIAKVFLKDGYRVVGIHEGYKNLFNGKAETVNIDFHYADRIFPRGGSTLRMSRHKPKDHEFSSEFFLENNIELLVTIGGDDTASTANRLTKYLIANDVKIQNIHVPKTIDNDIPLPGRTPTFGFNSAKNEGVQIGNTVYEDARTSGNWFVVSTMGRSAGHLAFEIGTSCHFPVIIIPEMFDNTEITFEKITNLVISSMLKRQLDGVLHGVALVSEGVFHTLSEDEIKNSGINFTYDDHGHPELGNVSKAHIFNILVQRKLKELGITIKSRPVEMGYELRCCPPVAYDLTLCTLLGMGVRKLFLEGKSGCIVSTSSKADIQPIFLADIEDPKTGKIPPRLVDTQSELAKMVFSDMHVLTEADYEAAREYVDNPEDFDFYKILGWEYDPSKLRPSIA
ncbi:6-phosphofructokinase [Pontibacter sp. G13]|uniref:6-phosphofructokinase n=1 Tax=Pontibacter sp. G13 TaxID=3074898 RepID=UPI00288AF9FF|nr:6-phosphofructokinase [Pontibacter sp. G13]WNJ21465.1 6-phosphofructokinase [Pontibacter sp. G13]